MANRRNTGTDPVVSGGAAAVRAKARVTRTHKSAAAAETSGNALASPAATSPDPTPAFDAIAHLAYSYWESRGYQGGSPEEDWLRAERELAH